MNRYIYRREQLNAVYNVSLAIFGFIAFFLGSINSWDYFSTKALPGYSLTLNILLIIASLISLVITVSLVLHKVHRLRSVFPITLSILFMFQILVLAGSSGF